MITRARTRARQAPQAQQGTTAVEFALVAMLLFVVILGGMEFGRMFFVFNTVQEVTRKAAREAVVRWTDQQTTVKRLALFGGTALPAGGELTDAYLTIEYTNTPTGPDISPRPIDAATNIQQCMAGASDCIRYVRVKVSNPDGTPLSYRPVWDFHGFFDVPIPMSTVVMPAESLGFRLS
jgi:hypothetical protein